MGSIRNVVNSSGTLLDTIIYDAFGNILSESSPANGGFYKAFGYRFDPETGMFRSDGSTERYYLVWIGRFNQFDPSLFGADDPNLWRYVGNNPTNSTDPRGMAAEKALKVTVSITDIELSVLDPKTRKVVSVLDPKTGKMMPLEFNLGKGNQGVPLTPPKGDGINLTKWIGKLAYAESTATIKNDGPCDLTIIADLFFAQWFEGSSTILLSIENFESKKYLIPAGESRTAPLDAEAKIRAWATAKDGNNSVYTVVSVMKTGRPVEDLFQTATKPWYVNENKKGK